MSFSQLVGNRAAIDRLRNMLSHGQVPTSLLFSGPDGVRKLAAALNLAKALNCTGAGDDAFDACDECPACRRIESGGYPDVRRIGPEGTGGQVKAEAVRQVVTESPFRPFEGRKRVYIFEAADRMNPTAANTLLKTLEESPSWIVLVLLTSHEAAILPTLLSRCQKIRFLPLLAEEVTDLLVAKHGFSLDDATLAASASGGSLARALATKAEELVQLRGEALEVAKLLAESPSRAELFAWADRLSKHGALAGILRLLVGLLRDLSCLASGEAGSILHSDCTEDLQALASRAPLEAWLQAYLLAEESLQDLEVRYANKRITLERLFLSLVPFQPISPRKKEVPGSAKSDLG
jgi:DNA polymerase-3 subunit delta'